MVVVYWACYRVVTGVAAHSQLPFQGGVIMKIFGVSLFTLCLLVIAYFVGAKWPGPANTVLSKF
jgi:hypothetical protein